MKTKKLLNHASKYTLFAAATIVYLLLMWIFGEYFNVKYYNIYYSSFCYYIFSIKAINKARVEFEKVI